MRHNVKLFSIVMALVIMFSAIGTAPVSAASVTAPSQGITEFSRCVVWDVQHLAQAKKLTPAGYQQMEKELNAALKVGNDVKQLLKDKYYAAIWLGVRIAKFIGYDFVWFVGIAQDCLPRLR